LRRAILKKGREAPVLKGHPWIFSGALTRVEDDDHGGPLVDVVASDGRWLARGTYNPHSQIRIRVLSLSPEEVDVAFLARRIRRALALRESLSSSADAYRVVNGEGDFLPGLIIDRYGEFLVCQFLTFGMDGLKEMAVEALLSVAPARGIYEKSHGAVREEEGLPPAVGALAGEEPPELVAINENGLRFLVNIRAGQKTGFFLDQREHRALLARLAPGRAILNCFGYTGAFAAYALKAGAKRLLSVESSLAALELARKNFDLNGLTVPPADLRKADAFVFLKNCPREFDIALIDPPSLAPRRRDVEAATRSYKFLNLHALRALKPGGLLLTFCCSQHISADLFQKIVFGAATDAGRRAQLLSRLGHAVDHPVSLHHPEGEYLKGLLLSVFE
jgi:23S rRNA (cytosine1962-C5)-methyltransferase